MIIAIAGLQVAAAGAAITSAWYWFRASRWLPQVQYSRRAAIWAGIAAGLAGLAALLSTLN